MKHDYYKSCGGDHCDNGSCPLCTLSVCQVCDCAEAELTTECPGERVGSLTREAIVAEKINYCNDRWFVIPERVVEWNAEQSAYLRQRMAAQSPREEDRHAV